MTAADTLRTIVQGWADRNGGDPLTAQALLDAYRTEVLAEAPPKPTPERCPRCVCGDCGGRLDQHTEDGCGCESCGPSPYLGPGVSCSLAEFVPEQRLSLLAEALAPWLSPHLNEAARLRWLAVAHAAHHALHDYDHRGDPDA